MFFFSERLLLAWGGALHLTHRFKTTTLYFEVAYESWHIISYNMMPHQWWLCLESLTTPQNKHHYIYIIAYLHDREIASSTVVELFVYFFLQWLGAFRSNGWPFQLLIMFPSNPSKDTSSSQIHIYIQSNIFVTYHSGLGPEVWRALQRNPVSDRFRRGVLELDTFWHNGPEVGSELHLHLRHQLGEGLQQQKN